MQERIQQIWFDRFLSRVFASDAGEDCRLHVDVVTAPPPVGEVEVLVPVGRAEFKYEVPTAPYRLFPIKEMLRLSSGSSRAAHY